ncbi:MAG TPA: hypothetical protein VGM03_10960 [Phycisphaerae bacterium]
MIPFSQRALRRWGVSTSGVLLTLGCQAAPQTPASFGPMYPAAPATPRVQFLTALSGERDLARDAPTWFRKLVGAPQAESTPLQKPYGLAAHAGRLYVCDTNRRDIFVFDFAAGTFSQWNHPGTALNKPVALRIGPDGGLDVCDAGSNQVLRFARDGRLIATLGWKEPAPEQAASGSASFHPVGIADGPDGCLAVLNGAAHRIELLDPTSGQSRGSWGSLGSREGQLYRPNGMAQARSGELLVSDPLNRRVMVFDVTGKPQKPIGEPGDQPGYIAHPRGLTVSDAGVVFLGDVALQMVQMFDLQGQYLMSFGQLPEGSAVLSPAGICVDRSCLPYFQRFIAPDFDAEYLIFVANQVGPDKILVYAFGHATTDSQASRN